MDTIYVLSTDWDGHVGYCGATTFSTLTVSLTKKVLESRLHSLRVSDTLRLARKGNTNRKEEHVQHDEPR